MPPIKGIGAHFPMDRIDAQLAQLENAQFVRRLDEDDPAFRFKHALSQEAAYGTILRKKRAGLHRRVAAAYEQFYPAQLDEFALLLGQHWTEAGDQDRAAGYLVRAGDAAARLFAPVEARWHYTHALTSLELLAASDDIIRRRIEATTRYAMVAFGSVPPDQILERLAAADLLAQKLSTGRPDRLLRAHLGSWIGRLHVITNRPLEGLEDFERVLSEARDLDEPDLLAISSGEIGLVRVRLGQCGGAEALLKPAIVHYEQVANWQQWTYLLAHLAMAEAAQGHVAVGFADSERMLSFANASHAVSAIAVSNLFLAQAYMLGDESARSLSASAACIELAQKTGELLLVNMAHGFHAWAASRLGDHAAAHASLTIHDETARQLGGQFVLPEQFASMRAEVALNAGEYERAVTLSQEAIRLAEPLGGIFGQGLAEKVWGQALSSLDPMLSDEAGTHLAASLRAFESGACVVEAARTHVAWGRLCQARGESDASREHFEKAAAQFQLSEMTRELEQTKHLIGSLSA